MINSPGVFSCVNLFKVTETHVSIFDKSHNPLPLLVFQTFAQRLYSHGWWIMSIFVALSTFGGVNGAMLTTSRIFFVAGEENQMPRIMAFLHIHKLTPLPAVVFTAFFSLLYLSVTDLYKLMNYLGFVQWFAISLSVLIVLIFRVTRKDAIRPVRVCFFPLNYR